MAIDIPRDASPPMMTRLPGQKASCDVMGNHGAEDAVLG
jgi:hypothetical protein